MTREELRQYRKISKEIQLLQEQLTRQEKELNQIKACGVVRGSSPAFPYVLHDIPVPGGNGGNKSLRAEYILTIRRLKQRLQLRQKELRKLETYIAGIHDSELRQIFLLRYVSAMSWSEIAAELGNDGDGSTERKKHNRFLKFP